MMKKPVIFTLLFLLVFSCEKQQSLRDLPVDVYRDKMKGAWIGQMAGVGWGLPTEFDWIDSAIAEQDVPPWNDEMINQQGNDDLYVEMTFMGSMDRYGLDVSPGQAGVDFANTGYGLWAANRQGRENLRYGIPPPASGHPRFNRHADDIDYQIEADYSGIIAPGMPDVVIELGEKFGRMMNYGDGLYGGLFVGGMYSAAYFEDDINKVIEAGLACIPDESLYEQCIRDVIRWHNENPADWNKTWTAIMDKYYRSLDHQPLAREYDEAWQGIDAKINGAFIVMGLLYGEGDLERTIITSMRCGLDSDCNPSNAAGVLGTIMGYEKIPEKFKRGLDSEKTFSYSPYNFNDILGLSEDFTREFIMMKGGEIIRGPEDKETFRIPYTTPTPPAFHPSYDPAPLAGDTVFSDSMAAKLLYWSARNFNFVTPPAGIHLEILHCSRDITPVYAEWNGAQQVFMTQAANDQRSVQFRITVDSAAVADGKKSLQFRAGAAADNPWKLNIRGNGERRQVEIGENSTTDGWEDIEIPLPDNRHSTINLSTAGTDHLHPQYWTDFSIVDLP